MKVCARLQSVRMKLDILRREKTKIVFIIYGTFYNLLNYNYIRNFHLNFYAGATRENASHSIRLSQAP